ncbi:MAG TPA: hypothetical protein VGK75_18415 [Casimicrobiaceae bacterium]|jgi:hypothetical protein
MNRSFFRPAALALASVALAVGITVLPLTPVQGATFTFSNANCSSFTLVDNGNGNSTLNCVVSAPPVCTVTGPTTGTLNNAITLTASCSPAATSWTWTAGNCAGVTTQTCSAVESTAVTRTYTVAGTNGIFVGSASPGYNVAWSNTVPAAPSGCSITSNPTSLPTTGGAIALTAQCSGGGAVATWTWSGPTTTTNGNTATATLTSTSQFSVQASNAGGSASANLTVQVATGGGNAISCSGFSKTVVLDASWSNPTRLFTINGGGFGVNDALVVRFTTGPNALTKRGGFSGAEYQSSPSERHATLSASPCDFGPGMFPPGSNASGNTISLQYYVGGTPVYYPVLQPSTTYYLNIMNVAPASCAATGVCDMFIDFSKPAS